MKLADLSTKKKNGLRNVRNGVLKSRVAILRSRAMQFANITTILILMLLLTSCATGNAVKDVLNVHQTTLEIEGMSCISCALGVEQQFQNIGVESVDVDLKSKKGVVVYDSDKTTAEAIAKVSFVYPAQVIKDV